MTGTDITFDSAGCALAATYLDVPSPLAAAVLITGSGRTDRNSDVRLPFGQVLRADITAAVAAALAPVRVTTLRYDKRGVGASGGNFYATGMDQRLADAAAALDWLAARQPGVPLLTIGHSEGAYHAARLAVDDERVAGAVLLAGSTRPGGEELAWQTEQIASRLPASARFFLKLMRTDAVSAQRKNQQKIMASADDVLRLQGTKVAARWFRDFVRYDPAPVLTRVSVPVLAITGGHDLQVPPADIETMGKLVAGPFEGHVASDLSHLLRSDPDCLGPRGYRRAGREPVSAEVLTLITDWVTRHFDGGPR
jgi:uncharacterized protein